MKNAISIQDILSFINSKSLCAKQKKINEIAIKDTAMS